MYLKLTKNNVFVKKSVAQNVLRGLKSLHNWAAKQVLLQEGECQKLVDEGALDDSAPVGMDTKWERATSRLVEREILRDQLKADFDDGVESYVAEFKEQPQLEYVAAASYGITANKEAMKARFAKA